MKSLDSTRAPICSTFRSKTRTTLTGCHVSPSGLSTTNAGISRRRSVGRRKGWASAHRTGAWRGTRPAAPTPRSLAMAG